MATRANKQTLSEVTTDNGKNMQEESTSDATANNNLNMQINNNQILQLSVQQDEINLLYAEAMEHLIESATTENNLRDGLNPSPFEPILPELWPGDIEIIVEAPTEPNTAPEEIVDSKTMRVDGAGQPSGTPYDHEICRGCAAIGHVLESCPEDHGLKLTDYQMHFIGQTNASANKAKPAGTGID